MTTPTLNETKFILYHSDSNTPAELAGLYAIACTDGHVYPDTRVDGVLTADERVSLTEILQKLHDGIVGTGP